MRVDCGFPTKSEKGNLDGWAGGPMTKEYFQHKVGILNRHCEAAGRDPGEIKHTVLMPTMVTDDKAAAAHFMTNRRLGEGAAVGSKNYVLDRVGEIIDAGADEIMIGGIPTDDVERYRWRSASCWKQPPSQVLICSFRRRRHSPRR